MADFPLLPIPAPAHRERKGRGFGGEAIRLPGRRRQGERLGPVFQRLRDAMDPDHPHTFGEDPAGIAPERALVFEIAGSVIGFRRAVARVDGFEFLGDEDTESAADEDFAVIDQRKGREGQDRDDALVNGRMYLAMPDLQALEQLLSLWRRHQAGESAAPGFAPWWHVFDRLRVLRAWGPEDRIPEGTIEWIRQMLADRPDAAQRIEVELLNCASSAKREAARRSFDTVLREAGGRLIDSASIPEVAYEAALVDLPSHALRNLIARRDVIALSDAVMAVRPQSIVSFPIASVETEAGSSQAPRAEIRGQPVAAVFDGVPVQRHVLLDGRLAIDDPDELDLRSDVALRHHGTAMASLVVHGDRNREELPLTRQVYFRPVLIPNDDGSWEEFPGDRLLIDTIYRAVKRMKEGDAEGEATAPTVFLVNLSLGDPRRPFAGPISPWARLLDYLAARYGILFLVSAGNITGSLPVPAYRSMTEIETATPSKQRQAVLDALGREFSQRTLLSPAEALNVLTVGAWHEDASTTEPPDHLVAPLGDGAGPNVTSAMGLGYRKVVKPDIMMPAGRELVRMTTSGGEPALAATEAGRFFGLRAAAPGEGGDLAREGSAGGTSAAAALATRSAHRLFEALMDEENGGILAGADPAFYGVVVKALLVHRARWGEEGKELGALYGPNGRGKHVERLDNVARVIGYGCPNIEEALTCASNRVTLLGYGELSADRVVADYRVPLPRSLERLEQPRSVTCTLAWFSPVEVRHRMYRRAKLDLERGPNLRTGDGFLERAKLQPSDPSVRRGSLLHVHFEGQRAASFVEDGELHFTVFCSAPAGNLDESVRYGLAVTIEAGEGIPVYEEVRQQLVVRPRV